MKKEKRKEESNIYYVYHHYRLKDGSLFYIGKGKNTRAYTKHGRNMHWKRIVDKDGGFNVVIIKKYMNNEDACKLEISEILKFGLKNLSNKTEGGTGGNCTVKMSKEQYEKWKIRHSEASKGKISYWKGKKRPEHSKFMTGRSNPKLKELMSKPKTEEFKRKLSESRTGKKLEKRECEKCHKMISTNNFKSHQLGSDCKPRAHRYKDIVCNICGKTISCGNIEQHQRGKKCVKGG